MKSPSSRVSGQFSGYKSGIQAVYFVRPGRAEKKYNRPRHIVGRAGEKDRSFPTYWRFIIESVIILNNQNKEKVEYGEEAFSRNH